MILIDTNIVSELAKPSPAPGVMRWFSAHAPQAVVSAIIVFELFAGAEFITDRARRKDVLALYRDVLSGLHSPVLVVDNAIAHLAATLAAQSRKGGVQLMGSDALIAATARQHRIPLATRNVKDFKATGLTLIDPWTAS